MGTWCHHLRCQDHPRKPGGESQGRPAHFFHYSFHHRVLRSSRLPFFPPSKIIEKKRKEPPFLPRAQFAQDHVLEAASRVGIHRCETTRLPAVGSRGPQSEQGREAPGSNRGRQAAASSVCKVEDCNRARLTRCLPAGRPAGRPCVSALTVVADKLLVRRIEIIFLNVPGRSRRPDPPGLWEHGRVGRGRRGVHRRQRQTGRGPG